MHILAGFFQSIILSDCFLEVLLSLSNRSFGFRNKDLKQILRKNWKTGKIAYSPHEMRSNFWLTKIISRGKLCKLREHGAVKKIQSSHCYQLTKGRLHLDFLLIFQFLVYCKANTI